MYMFRYTDEGVYKCEVTFLEIYRGCPVVQSFKLRQSILSNHI